jgi:hypothetical protein
MKLVAASVASLAAGTISSCDIDQSEDDGAGGIRPGDVWIETVEQFEKFCGTRFVVGHFVINRTELRNLDGLESLHHIGGELIIDTNLKLENLNGLSGLIHVGPHFSAIDNEVLPACEPWNLHERLRALGWDGDTTAFGQDEDGVCDE